MFSSPMTHKQLLEQLIFWLMASFSCSPLRVTKLHLESPLFFCVMDGVGHCMENIWGVIFAVITCQGSSDYSLHVFEGWSELLFLSPHALGVEHEHKFYLHKLLEHTRGSGTSRPNPWTCGFRRKGMNIPGVERARAVSGPQKLLWHQNRHGRNSH